MGVKSYQVSAIHAFKNLPSPLAGQQAKYFIRRKRNMKEETNLGTG